jgi:hypothetical protein
VKGNDPAMPVVLPPRVGDRWRLNVVRPDYRSGGGGPTVSSWNRISIADFHALDRMLNVVFADAQGSITARASTSPAATPTEPAPETPTPTEPTPSAPATGPTPTGAAPSTPATRPAQSAPTPQAPGTPART